MNKKHISDLRSMLRLFERELYFQNNTACCNGVSLAQCHTLLELENKSKTSITELSDALNLDKSTVSRTIDGLVNIGLVKRKTSTINRRKATVNLTNEGKQVCSNINYNNNTYLEKALSDFTDEQKELLIDLFKKLTHNMVQIRKQEL